MELTGKILKVDDEMGMAFGWASIATRQDGSVVIDKQDDVIPVDELEKAAYAFVLDARVAGEMHIRKGVGQLVESMVFTHEKLDQLATNPFTGTFDPEAAAILKRTIPQGWWLGFYLTDPVVRKRVKDGTYPEFSIHGSGVRTPA